ncbi:4-(cytidine 5'-diphospho)-2-C-methyl-D-erythritol kinase [Inquilinus sp. CAU 1745]|uniref:4-(cytidine 5'-diphospho)-2-C-methyl-D-erythritol kinase n=1 Tax=Inquilinus sp. CAU 1745 TaxID=3140369 RepID=UPI00325AA3FC
MPPNSGRPAATAVSVIEEPAPAKLNLYLHVTGRRPDGYHLLDSLFAFADIGDRIRLRPGEGPSLSVDGPFASAAPAGPDNLALKALLALAEAVGRPPGVAMELTKALPVAAGIGGGSADAAAVLRGLCRLWDIDRRDPRIRTVAGSLGADVPACLLGAACFAAGIGDELTPAPSTAGLPVVLVNPGVALATPDVFRARTGGFSAAARFDDRFDNPSDPRGWAAALRARRNDLTPAALALAPEIGEVLAILEDPEGCLLARMSGSGATCFGLFEDHAAARAAAEAIAARRPGWWVRPARLL